MLVYLTYQQQPSSRIEDCPFKCAGHCPHSSWVRLVAIGLHEVSSIEADLAGEAKQHISPS